MATRSRIPDVPRNLTPYFLGLYRRGPRWDDTEGEEAAGIIPRQLAFLRQQVEAGRYLFAGPVTADEHYTGMMIVVAPNAEEAERLAESDPAVRSGRLAVEIRPVLLPSLTGIRVEY